MISHLMSFLWDDIDSLNSASLVCHLWRNASLSHIYRSIPLTSEFAFGKLQSLLADPKLPNLKAWIREICLICGTLDGKWFREWTTNIPKVLAKKLPNVYTIKFIPVPGPPRGKWKPQPEEYRTHGRIISTFSQAKEIRIEGPMSLYAIWATIEALPHLKHFRISHPLPSWVSPTSVPTANYILPPKGLERRLESLWLEGCEIEMRSIMLWAGSPGSLRTLRELTVGVETEWACQGLVKLLPDVAGRLVKLELKVDDERFVKDNDGQTSLIDISTCTALQTLTLSSPHSATALKLINQIPFSTGTLHTILFDIHFDPYDSIKLKDCKAMDERLSQPDANHVREIGFRYDGGLNLDAAKSTIVSLFPLIAAQGKLEVYI